MKKRYLRRSAIAVGLIVATVMSMANPNPAGAAVHNGTIDAGVLTSTKTGVTETFNLAPTTPSCTTATLQSDFGTPEATSGSPIVTSLSSSHVTAYSNGSSYLTVLTRSTTGNSAGHWTTSGATSSHTFTSSRVAIVATIYNTTSCTPTGTPVCTVANVLHLESTVNSSSTSGTTYTAAVVASVGAVVAFPTCTAGPSQILGTTITQTTALTGTITT